MRGYYRSAAGPGWALVGDAGHFKHPTTAQGIGDALAQAEYVAGSARGRRPRGVRAVAERAVRRGLRVLLPRGAASRAGGRGTLRGAGSGPGCRPTVPGHVHPAGHAVQRVHPRAVPALAGGVGVRGRPRRLVALVDGLSTATFGPGCPRAPCGPCMTSSPTCAGSPKTQPTGGSSTARRRPGPIPSSPRNGMHGPPGRSRPGVTLTGTSSSRSWSGTDRPCPRLSSG